MSGPSEGQTEVALAGRSRDRQSSCQTWFLLFREGKPRWCSGKNLPANARDVGLIPGSERSSGVENGNPLQYSCLENLRDREAWRAIVTGSQQVGHN